MSDRPRIAIAGAGIGGLTAALCLARTGLAVDVFERAPALEEVGAGIQLSPNASRVLIDLGLEAALAPAVVAPGGMDVRSGPAGSLIVAAELGEDIARRHGAPWWVVHRADLLAVLAEAARAEPAIRIETGATVEGARAVDGGVELVLDRAGETQSSTVPAVIGADGIRSVVRSALGEGDMPVFRQRVAWRATLPMAAVPAALRGDRVGLWLGPDAHLVHYPLRGGADFNVVVLLGEPRPVEGWRAPGDPAYLHRRLAGWSPLPRALIDLVKDWQCWSLADRATWFGPGHGAVTLLGDAAHAMLPFAAQGGAMAIEDAAVLARTCARRPDDLAAAFRSYERARAGRVARVQDLARRNGMIYHLAGPMAVARDMAMRLLGGRGLIARQDWIYGFRA
ncbi:FAD-dependent monooxygenase [Phreatobacter sp. HK31-P]